MILKPLYLWTSQCACLWHWCSGRKKGSFLSQATVLPSLSSDPAVRTRRYLLLEDGVAPGISEITQFNLITWLEEACCNWTSFLVFSRLFFFKPTVLGFCQILTRFITTSRQQESSFLRRQSLFLTFSIPKLSGPTFPFTFQQPRQPALDQREQIHFFPEYSPVRTPRILAPDCRGPSSGASPLTMQRKDTPQTESALETAWLYPTPSTEEGENCQVGPLETWPLWT